MLGHVKRQLVVLHSVIFIQRVKIAGEPSQGEEVQGEVGTRLTCEGHWGLTLCQVPASLAPAPESPHTLDVKRLAPPFSLWEEPNQTGP